MWEAQQAVLGVELEREEDFYSGLDEVHDVRWFWV